MKIIIWLVTAIVRIRDAIKWVLQGIFFIPMILWYGFLILIWEPIVDEWILRHGKEKHD